VKVLLTSKVDEEV